MAIESSGQCNNAAFTSERVISRGDGAAQPIDDVAGKCLLVRGSEVDKRGAAEGILVAAAGQEINGGYVQGGPGLDDAAAYYDCAVISDHLLNSRARGDNIPLIVQYLRCAGSGPCKTKT